ncbi:hypothetical protein GWK47_040519 [Chionoecetes opilio]|uniref:Uncharacterized protein n=1 Tax=Chionoecetes opilio TaxID=41210 RepID=A0A8J4YAM7_CHIOP|nr:hypothetical protein GWK47_040519 [Chionoecetes opilio]
MISDLRPPAGDSDGQPRKLSTDQLNEDMERMFENEGAKEDFSLSKLSSSPAVASNPWSPGFSGTQVREADDLRIDDSDIKYHRSDTFPHVHHPLKPQQFRSGSRRGSRKSRNSESQDTDKEEKEERERKEEEEEKAKLLKEEKKKSGGVLFEIGDPELEEGWSVGSGKPSRDHKDSTMESDAEEQSPLLASDPKPKRSHKSRRNDTAEDPAWRRHLGSEHSLQSAASTSSTPTTAEEAMNLDEHDLEVMSSHRFDDPSAYRRPKVRARSSASSIIHVSDKDDNKVTKADRQMSIMKKSIDHTPHEVS